jgi:hypothetical protein
MLPPEDGILPEPISRYLYLKGLGISTKDLKLDCRTASEIQTVYLLDKSDSLQRDLSNGTKSVNLSNVMQLKISVTVQQ